MSNTLRIYYRKYGQECGTGVDVPLGDGWEILENPDADPGMDIVFGFDHDGHAVELKWKVMTEDEIDKFGGWHNPVISMDGFDLEIRLDGEAGETDAVRLMMSDSDKALDWIRNQ